MTVSSLSLILGGIAAKPTAIGCQLTERDFEYIRKGADEIARLEADLAAATQRAREAEHRDEMARKVMGAAHRDLETALGCEGADVSTSELAHTAAQMLAAAKERAQTARREARATSEDVQTHVISAGSHPPQGERSADPLDAAATLLARTLCRLIPDQTCIADEHPERPACTPENCAPTMHARRFCELVVEAAVQRMRAELFADDKPPE